jgi:hypothetical protein
MSAEHPNTIEVADDHAHRAAHERVDAAAVPAGRTSRRRAPQAADPLEDTSQQKSTSAR